MMILKLNFGKAYNIIEHEVIMNVMKHQGFGTKW
jgi:hypothetical protein